VSSSLLRYQIESAAWANQRVLSAACKLTPQELTRDFHSSEHSVLGTLVHICRSERMWLSRIQGPLVGYRVAGDDTLSALESAWPQVNQKWIEWAGRLTDETAQAELNYRDMRGNEWTTPVWKIVLHVVNHSTHHRGQAIGFIRAMGYVPPNTDSISFARAL
jgi:uncharacterized damage-inducible protein DinB